MKSAILGIFLAGFSINGKAQALERYNSFSYNVNEGLLQSTIWDMAFDRQNFCWISFPNGIQKFDGKNFSNVKIQDGLPDDKWVSFFKCKNGSLLLSHARGISRYDVDNNRFNEVFKFPSPRLDPARFIGETDAIHLFTDENTIISLNPSNYKVISSVKTGLPTNAFAESHLKISETIVDDKVAILLNRKLYQWDLKRKKLDFSSESIPDIFFTFLQSLPGEKVLYHTFSNEHGLHRYDFKTGTSKLIRKDKMNSRQGYRSAVYRWQNKNLFSYFHRIYEIDSTLQSLQKELVNFQNKPLAGIAPIGFIRQDNFKNLYLVTTSGGFTKVISNNLPIKYYGAQHRESNFVLSVLADKKHNRILAGTRDSGLYIFDTLQQLVKHIKKLPGSEVSFSVSSIAMDNTGCYLLFVPSEKKVWKINPSTYGFEPFEIVSTNLKKVHGFSYFCKILYQSPREVFVQSQHLFYKVDLQNKRVSEFAFNKAKSISGLFYKGQILTHGADELLFYDTATFKEVKHVRFENTGGVRCFAVDKKSEIFLGTNKGVFKTDTSGKVLFHLNSQNGLADECIYAMAFDKDENLWASTNKGVFRLNKNLSINHFKKEEGLQENEFNTNSVAVAEDGEIYFGGVNGISSFIPDALTNTKEDINLLFTSVKANNRDIEGKAAWEVEAFTKPYDENNISFDFIALAKNYPAEYIYQYKMRGIDDEWIENKDLQTVRYSLPPGDYVFQIYASRFFNKDAMPMKEIAIIISPPFWRSWWFLTCIGILILGITAVVIKQNTSKHYTKKLLALEAEHKIQLERERISRELHDDLGTRANMLVYNTSLIDEKITKDEMIEIRQRIQEASGDMLLSLRETVWALKQEDITVEDVWTRFKNFLAKMQRTYSHIQFKSEDADGPVKNLKYNEALNAIRILQEAVNNAVKHASCTHIDIRKSFDGNKFLFTITDNGKGMGEHLEDSSGSGIENMQHRAKESAFGLEISSNKETGTQVILAI